jgi:Glycosyltransferase family 87
VRWVTSSYHNLALILVLPLLLLMMGFAPGAQMNANEALQVASSLPVPEIKELLSHPGVEASADYNQTSDSWHIILAVGGSRTQVAELWVADDKGEPENVKIFSPAEAVGAIEVAATNAKVRQELAKHSSQPSAYASSNDGQWQIYFEVEERGELGGLRDKNTGKKAVAEVGVDKETLQPTYVWTGDQVAWQMARGGYDYGRQANYPYIWWIMGFIFALAFVRIDKFFHIRNLDVLALVGLFLSQNFFKAADVHWAVLLWYPPLLYLLARTLLMGFGYGERVEKTSNFPTPLLLLLGTFAGGFLLSLNLDSGVLDVGYAGVAGGDRILEGVSPYGNMPSDIGWGDTYGPLNYLLYIPFIWLLGWSGTWDYLPAAHGLTALAFVAGALALLLAGRRYAGTRGGAALLFAWTVFPFTLYATNQNSNDIIVGAVAAIGLATATSPLARGMTVGAGFAIKLFPLILAPLWMLHDFSRRRVAPILKFVLGGTVVLVLSFWVLALGGDPVENAKLFYERTFVVQSTRESPFSIFAQLPVLGALHLPLTAAVVLLALLVAVVPKKRTIRRLAAFSAALIIAFQLVLLHWFFAYVVWFEPFVFFVLLLATNEQTALDGEKRYRQAAVGYTQKGAGGEQPTEQGVSSRRAF